MKKLLAVLLVFMIMLSVCGCSKTSVDATAEVTLTFIYGEENINVTLEADEAEEIITILDGNSYDPVLSAVPSCGFDKNISLKVGDRVFAVACDKCNCMLDYGNLRYFEIPQEDMEYIRSVFEKYGGYFPCV